MKKILLLFLVILVSIGIYGWWFQRKPQSVSEQTQTTGTASAIVPSITPTATVLAEGLDTPWSIVFLPDKSALITERKGTIRKLNPDGKLAAEFAIDVPGVREGGEGGLMGLAIHPKFEENKYIYVYFTYDNNGARTKNKVVRYVLDNTTLKDEKTIIDEIPGASNHNGGRLKFGPDGYLYITTGDADEPSLAQNTRSVAGKILRVTDSGEAVPGNLDNGLVYSYGHRNAQGLAWDEAGNLWSTEHGRSGIQSGFDELNLIRVGANYGWPNNQGDVAQNNTIPPVLHSGPNETWAPGSLAYHNHTLYFGGLRGSALYAVPVQDGKVGQLTKFFANQYGRIREVVVSPDGELIISTSNRDGRGKPASNDDRIMKISLPSQ